VKPTHYETKVHTETNGTNACVHTWKGNPKTQCLPAPNGEGDIKRKIEMPN